MKAEDIINFVKLKSRSSGSESERNICKVH